LERGQEKLHFEFFSITKIQKITELQGVEKLDFGPHLPQAQFFDITVKPRKQKI